MNNTSGTKFRVVSGYRANSAVFLAMERGEVEGVTGSWSSVKSERPNWVRDKQVRVLVQFARARASDSNTGAGGWLLPCFSTTFFSTLTRSSRYRYRSTSARSANSRCLCRALVIG